MTTRLDFDFQCIDHTWSGADAGFRVRGGAQNAEGRVAAGGARPLLLQLGGGGGERCKLPHWGLWRSRSGGSRIVG